MMLFAMAKIKYYIPRLAESSLKDMLSGFSPTENFFGIMKREMFYGHEFNSKH